jgi:hypothetical protein
MTAITTVHNAQQQPYNAVASLTRYLNHRSKPSVRELKEKLSPHGHDVLCSKLNAARPLQQRDANTTRENINGIMKKWKRYVQEISREVDRPGALIRVLDTAYTEGYRAGKERCEQSVTKGP